MKLTLDIPHKVGGSPNEIFICCPFCITKRGKADEDFKMGVNVQTGKFNCFKCLSRNSNTKLNFLKNIEMYHDDSVDLQSLKDRIDGIGVRTPNKPVDLDKYSWPLEEDDTPMAYQYVKERGFTDQDIYRLNLRVGKTYWDVNDRGEDYECKKWEGRVIFPFMEDDKPMFMCGRSYTGRDPKYRNSDDRSKGPYVYGLERVTNGTAILCEGIISSLAAERVTGVTGICTLGYFATWTQLMKIRTKVHTIYMCLDGGVDETVVKRLKKQLQDFDLNVYQINLPEEKDPDDLGLDFIPFFQNAKKLSIV